MGNTFVMTGTLADCQTVRLDEPLPVSAGQVRVTVEVLPSNDPLNLAEFFNDLRQRQQARGHVPLSREEADALMREERAGWDDRP